VKIQKLKRAMIKEEYVAITGNTLHAIILNQMIYWSERINDFDKFIEEENKRQTKYFTPKSMQDSPMEQPLTHGWIYKKAEDIKDEIMSTDSAKTINRYLTALVEKEFLDRRRNPNLKYDRTYQYRVNLPNIIKALAENGYTLQDYKVDLYSESLKNTKGQNDASKSQNETFEGQNDVSKGQNVALKGQNVGAIPEIITKIITEDKTTTVKEEPENVVVANIPLIDSIYKEIKNTIGAAVTKKVIGILLKEKGEVEIKKYLSNWTCFKGQSINNKAAFFVKAVMEGYGIPVKQESEVKQGNNNQYGKNTEFDQRKYSDEFYNSLYENGGS